jgi:uncharacterized membrane protein YraQ (UPF0718 family)
MDFFKSKKTKLLTAMTLAGISILGILNPYLPTTYVNGILINKNKATIAILMAIVLFFLYFGYLLFYDLIYNRLGVFPSAKTKKAIFYHRIVFRSALFLLTMLVYLTLVLIVGFYVHIYHINPNDYFPGAA